MVRLGHGGGEMKRLEDDAVDRAVAALGRQRAIAEAHGAEVRAVATSAVREAENRHVFLRRAPLEAGVRVEVISGFEEARLIHLGVLQAVPVYDRRVLVVDIGGGSTEIVLGERDEAIVARSLKLGAIRLTDRFFPDVAIKGRAVTRARRHIQGVLAPMQREIDRFDVAVASSGTAQSVAAMALAARGVDPGQSLNQVVITEAELSRGRGVVAGGPHRGRASEDRRPRRRSGRHHRGGGPGAPGGPRRVRGHRGDDLGVGPARRRPGRHLHPHPWRVAPPPAGHPSTGGPAPRRAHRRRPGALRAVSPPRPPALRPARGLARPRRRGPGAAWRPPRCCATSVCSSRTPAITNTATT